MVNYRCNAACRHCLYACSPTREAGYITLEMTRKVCRLLRAGRCRSVHIGGGEPFLDFDGLVMVVQELNSAGIQLEYVETNGFWASMPDAPERLRRLLAVGVDTLCISLDPFHAEYVAYSKPLRLARLCDEAGMNYFLWKEQFLSPLSRLEADKSHSRAEMEARLSPAYIRDTARAYGIRLGGRAVNIERAYGQSFLCNELADDKPCSDLLSTNHFHVDLHGYFIPSGCTGLRLPLAELIAGIPDGRYPAFEALYQGGVTALLRLARERGEDAQLPFAPDEAGYPSKCNLCFHLRRYLAQYEFAELDAEHYEESLKYSSI
jgi:hypothetical protein